MFRYEYVTIKYKGLIGVENKEYRDIIDIYAKKGFRYVGHIPKTIRANGQLNKIDLIFEIND